MSTATVPACRAILAAAIAAAIAKWRDTYPDGVSECQATMDQLAAPDRYEFALAAGCAPGAAIRWREDPRGRSAFSIALGGEERAAKIAGGVLLPRALSSQAPGGGGQPWGSPA